MLWSSDIIQIGHYHRDMYKVGCAHFLCTCVLASQPIAAPPSALGGGGVTLSMSLFSAVICGIKLAARLPSSAMMSSSGVAVLRRLRVGSIRPAVSTIVDWLVAFTKLRVSKVFPGSILPGLHPNSSLLHVETASDLVKPRHPSSRGWSITWASHRASQSKSRMC